MRGPGPWRPSMFDANLTGSPTGVTAASLVAGPRPLKKESVPVKKDLDAKLKKLSLNRETLRCLKDGELVVVPGGASLICTERCTGVSCYC